VQRIYRGTIIGLALALAAPAAIAQTQPSGGSSPTVCQTINGRVTCRSANRTTGVPGRHAYERWNDDSVTGGSANPAPAAPRAPPRFHTYIGGYNAGYGFGK